MRYWMAIDCEEPDNADDDDNGNCGVFGSLKLDNEPTRHPNVHLSSMLIDYHRPYTCLNSAHLLSK